MPGKELWPHFSCSRNRPPLLALPVPVRVVRGPSLPIPSCHQQRTDEALFPNEYVVSDDDKTLKAMTEDGFFVSTEKDLLTPAMSGKMYTGFFMDLLHLSAKGEERTATSLPVSESNTASTQSQQKVAISQALEYAKGLSPATETSQLLSHSLFHNFLKYVASMEHLAYPDLPFWCPRYVSNLFGFSYVKVSTLSPFQSKQLAQPLWVTTMGQFTLGSDISPRSS
jgi:hypothetical protein